MKERDKLLNNVLGKRPGHESPKNEIVKKNEASEINLLHQSILQDVSNAIQSGIIIGEKLSKQKEKIGHGNWIPWMKANLQFSDSTAKRYIRIYENRDRLNRSSMTDLNSALKFISESKSEEKDVTPTESPASIYKKFSSGENIGRKEKEILRPWLSKQYATVETKLKKIKSDLDKI